MLGLSLYLLLVLWTDLGGSSAPLGTGIRVWQWVFARTSAGTLRDVGVWQRVNAWAATRTFDLWFVRVW